MSEKHEHHSHETRVSVIKPHYTEIVEGAELPDGRVVDVVHAKGPDFVIYSVKGERDIKVAWTRHDEKTNECLRRIELLIAKATAKFQGVHWGELNHLYVAALRSTFSEEPVEASDKAIKEFEHYIETTKEVRMVLANTPEFVVWINDDDKASFAHDRSLLGVDRSLTEFSRIGALANAILPVSYQRSFHRRLGAALVTAFRLKPGNDVGGDI